MKPMNRRWEWLTAAVNENGYTTGAEIGVRGGDTSVYLLNNAPQVKTLYGIDAWRAYPGSDANEAQQAHIERVFLKRAYQVMTEKRLIVLRDKSSDPWILNYIPDQSLDFVFIDADHKYESVFEDITNYRPKVKPGGLLSGHDISMEGVSRAVTELVPGYQLANVDDVWFKFLEE